MCAWKWLDGQERRQPTFKWPFVLAFSRTVSALQYQNYTQVTILSLKSYIRTFICTVYSSTRNSDAVSTLGSLPRSKKVCVIKILSGRRNTITKKKKHLQNGVWNWPGICFILGTVPEIPGRMVTLALIRVIQYCVRPQWWMCMHVFQQTAVCVLRPNYIPAESSWNVALRSVRRRKFHLHIFFIGFK
jgi:hypothetical protein